jgi:hypothetical protein
VLLSRFWYVVLAVLLAFSLFLLYLATSVSNRDAQRTAGRLLTAASKSVGWFLTDDARKRASALTPLALDSDVRQGVAKASDADAFAEVTKIGGPLKAKLNKFRDEARGGVAFDVVWAIDRRGRVVANVNYEQNTGSEHFEMGGYGLVADALHGWIRDDAWIWDGKILRVVAVPVETAAGGTPVGAIVGGKWVDDAFAQAITDSTGAAVAFYANATRIATGSPPEFDRAALEIYNADIEKLDQNDNYREKGRTAPLLLREGAGFDTTVVFAKMPGEAWDLGGGFVVGHRQARVSDPLEFQRIALEDDKAAVPLLYLILIAAGAALIGLILSFVEHTMPLSAFRRAVAILADKKSDTDVLKPSTFRGVYKKIAQHVNDALDKVAAQSGIDRGPADLERVLGPLPSQPQMSAFSVPKGPGAPAEAEAAAPSGEARSVPKPRRSLPKPPSRPGDEPANALDTTAGVEEAAAPAAAPTPPPRPLSSAGDDFDEETEWRGVYEQFVALKNQLGESTDKLTYEKFRGTLQRNKEALVARHGSRRVSFRVYEKEGRAALKASPVKE